MIIANLLFYVFAALIVISALAVICVKNPVHAVLCLIFAFFNAAGIIVLLGAEFLAMTLVIVYVGAVAVLFLFVVMMLNINFTKLKSGFLSYFPFAIIVAGILLADFYFIYKASQNNLSPIATAQFPMTPESITTNTHQIGEVLYTEYFYPFQIAGVILLVAMIGAIVLTHRKKEFTKKQKISDQVFRDSRETVELVKVKSGSGVNV